MQNNVDFSRFGILDEVALKKTRRLGKYYAYRQMDYRKVELSLFYLWKLIPEQDDEILNRISAVFSEVTKVQNAQLIWARLCVAARFFYHDDPVWQNLLCPKLEERILQPDLTADVQTATALLGAYFADLTALKGEAKQSPSPVLIEAKPEKSSYCKYIVQRRFPTEFYTLDEFEEMFRRKSEATAPEFCKFLKENERLGLLDFTVDYEDVSTIQIQLKKHFPTMRNYSYQNFHKYFDCKIKNQMS